MLSQRVIAGLRRRRLDRGLTATEVAELVAEAGYDGLNRGVIAKLENGIRSTLTMEEFIAWCAVLDADPISLLLEAGVGSSEPASYWEVTRSWCVKARSWEEAVSLAAPGRHATVRARQLSGPPGGAGASDE